MREVLAEVRKKTGQEQPNDVYAAGANIVIGELMERMSNGVTAPRGSFVENVHLKTEDGELVGFRFYLVTGEARSLGPTRSEVVEAG
jgi:hypothetical protein